MKMRVETRIVAVIVAIVAMLLMASAPAGAQGIPSEAEDAGFQFVNVRDQQAIVVLIFDLEATDVGRADLTGLMTDSFVENTMDGFRVMESAELDALQLASMGADRGKLFGLLDTKNMMTWLMLVLQHDDELIMIGYTGFESDADFRMAVDFAGEVVRDGTKVRTPAGFVRQ